MYRPVSEWVENWKAGSQDKALYQPVRKKMILEDVKSQMQLYSLDALLPESVNDWETDFWLELSAYYRNQSSQYCAEEPRHQHCIATSAERQFWFLLTWRARRPSLCPTYLPVCHREPWGGNLTKCLCFLHLVTLSHLRALVYRKDMFFSQMNIAQFFTRGFFFKANLHDNITNEEGRLDTLLLVQSPSNLGAAPLLRTWKETTLRLNFCISTSVNILRRTKAAITHFVMYSIVMLMLTLSM